jgi:phosphonate transport system substrate-binding protein
MKTRTSFKILLTVSVLLLLIAACTPQTETVEVTRVVTQTEEVEVPVEVEVEVPVEVTRVVTETVVEEVMADEAAIGSPERPIKVLFVPSVDVDQIISGGDVLANALTEATGLSFEVSVPTSYAATIEEMCASPDDTIGFIPALGYVLANNRCGVTAGAAAVRRGLSWYASQYVVPFDSPAESLADLAGLTWCIPEFGSTSGYLYPQAELLDEGIEVGEIIEAGGHNGSVLGVYNGDCDFSTSFFSPPLLPSDEDRTWTYGVDSPEIWRDAGMNPEVVDGNTLVAGGPAEGGYQILDARTLIMETAPDVFEQTRILSLTDKIPNDSISFGPEFPLSMANEIVKAMVDFAASDACLQSICSEDFYSWSGLEPVGDSFYDPVRVLIDNIGISEEDILGG